MKMYSFTRSRVRGLNATVISSDVEKQKSFNQGQIYVAFSRVININSVHVIGKYNVNVIQVNGVVTTEYSRIREQSLTLVVP